jgi:hypothetical protein
MLQLFASKLLLEALRMYKDLLLDILNCFNFGGKSFGWMSGNKNINILDDVNYADIIPVQLEPGQIKC